MEIPRHCRDPNPRIESPIPLEIEPLDVVVFVCLAAPVFLAAYFVPEVHWPVVFLFAFGGSTSFAKIVMEPILGWIVAHVPRCRISTGTGTTNDKILRRLRAPIVVPATNDTNSDEACAEETSTFFTEPHQHRASRRSRWTLTPLFLVASSVSLAAGACWVVATFWVSELSELDDDNNVALNHQGNQRNAAWSREDQIKYHFQWIYQDIMGACITCSFLSRLQVNSLRNATVFLGALWFYDFFFIYLVPLFWDDLNAGSPSSPGHKTLPMVLLLPWFGHSESLRYSTLGLGDVILPGLALSLAARIDHANQLATLVNIMPQQNLARNSAAPPSIYSLVPMTHAFTVGKCLSTAALWLSNGHPQPALVFVNPICLGMLALWARLQCWDDVWIGPVTLTYAENLVQHARGLLADNDEDDRPDGGDSDGIEESAP